MGVVGAYKVDLLPSLSSDCTTKEIKQFSRAALVGKKIIWEVGSFDEFKKIYKETIETKVYLEVTRENIIDGRRIERKFAITSEFIKPSYVPNAKERADFERAKPLIRKVQLELDENYPGKVVYVPQQSLYKYFAASVLSKLNEKGFIKVI